MNNYTDYKIKRHQTFVIPKGEILINDPAGILKEEQIEESPFGL